MATVKEAAAHIDVGKRRFYELVEAGAIERRAPGEYELAEVRVGYIRHLREVAAGRVGDSSAELSTERALLAREQREGQSLKNAVARSEYVLLEDVGRQVEREYATVRERLLAIPGKLADTLAGLGRDEITGILQGEIVDALAELSADPGDHHMNGGGSVGNG